MPPVESPAGPVEEIPDIIEEPSPPPALPAEVPAGPVEEIPDVVEEPSPPPAPPVEVPAGPAEEIPDTIEEPSPPVPVSPVAEASGSAEKPSPPAATAPKAPASTAAKPKASRPAAVAKRKSSKPVDIIAVAAGAVCGGQSPHAVEYELVKHGMKQLQAQQMAEFMATSFEEHQEQQKQRKATMWARLLGGLLLAIICSIASFLAPNQHGLGFKAMVVSFVVVGLFLFISGLWRFAAGPRPTRPEDLIAAWKKGNKS